MHHLSIIMILQPFSDNTHINMFKSMLAMDHATRNTNGKIWLFWANDFSCKILETDEQQITCEINHVESPKNYINTLSMPNARTI